MKDYFENAFLCSDQITLFRLYVTGGQNTLYALDALTGEKIWNFTTDNMISSSPTVVGGVVYVSNWDRNMYALDALTGAKIWNYTIGGEGEVDSSPAVADGVVYIGSGDNNVYALNALTGAKIWNYTTGNVVYSSPTVANGVVYVGSWDHNMYALDTLTGEKIWHFPTGSVIFSSPAVANGLVYFGSLDGKVYAVGSAPKTANLMIGNSAPGFYQNASVMNYTLSYWNQGSGYAENVVLIDYLPPSVVYLSGTKSPVYESTTRTVTWNLGNIPPLATGTQFITISIPSSVPYGTFLNNSAKITTSTKETMYTDNTAWALTKVAEAWTPRGVRVSPSVPSPLSVPCVDWLTPVSFSYNQTLCPEETPVSIRISIDDGGPEINAPMTGGPRIWNFSATFYPRFGSAKVAYLTLDCSFAGMEFPIYIEPAGYIYDNKSGTRLQGAEIWLQRPDQNGTWENIPEGLTPPPMQPDRNPLITNGAGQFQWDLSEGSYRVYVEAEGYKPAASTMVNAPLPAFNLIIGLEPIVAPTTGSIAVNSTPTGAEIYLDGGDTGQTTPFTLTGVSTGYHEVVLKLNGYKDNLMPVTVTAGQTTAVHATLEPVTLAALFNASPLTGQIPLSVQFTDSSSGLPPLTYQWNFGDGSQMTTEKNPVHNYTRLGTYSVTLTVTDAARKTSSLTKNKYIITTDASTLKAEFTAAPLTGSPPLTVQFTDVSSGNPTKFFWTFGDRGTSYEKSPFHIYTTPGEYSVALKVTNGTRSYTKKVGKMIIVR